MGDIDLRKSPPGGWHGTYMNELAHGINTANQTPTESSYADDEQETEVLFESASGVPSRNGDGGDSLFTSTSSKPVLGGVGREYRGNGDGIYKAGKEEGEEDILKTRYGDKKSSFTIV